MMKNICAFTHIIGSPSSYMTLHLIPSEFPYIWWKFSFLFYQCGYWLTLNLYIECRCTQIFKNKTMNRFQGSALILFKHLFIVNIVNTFSTKKRRLLCTTTECYTAKTKHRNFETNIPRKGISGSQSQFPHSCACERFIHPTIGLPILLEQICRPI